MSPAKFRRDCKIKPFINIPHPLTISLIELNFETLYRKFISS